MANFKTRILSVSIAAHLSFLGLQVAAYSATTDPAVKNRSAISAVDEISAIPEQAAQKSVPLMMEKLAKMLEANPRDFRAHFLLARCYEKLGMEDLENSEDKAAELGGDEYKQFLLWALKKKIQQNQFDAALAYNSFAEKFFPKDATVRIAQAHILHKAGKYIEEEALLTDILKTGEKEPGVYSALASMKVEKGKFEEGIQLFDKEIALYPEYEPAQLGKAKTLELMRHYREALSLAVPLYMDNIFHYELATLVANCFTHLGIYDKAFEPSLVSLAVAQKSEQLDDAKRRLRFLWTRLTPIDRKKRLSGLTAILDKTVFGPRLHFALGDALQQDGFYRDAELQFREGLKLEPGHARAYLHLAEIYQNNFHDNSAALVNYVRYLRLQEDPAINKRMLRLVQEKARDKDIALRIKRRLNGIRAQSKR